MKQLHVKSLSVSLTTSLLALSTGWIYLQSVQQVCYSFLGFALLGNVLFWTYVIPVIRKYGQIKAFNFNTLSRAILLVLGLIIVNQVGVYALVSLGFKSFFGCESTYSMLQTLQINHFLPHSISYLLILGFVNRGLFRDTQLEDSAQVDKCVWLKQNGESIRLSVNLIQAIEADNNTISIFHNGSRYVSYQSLTSFINELDDPDLIRVHKSYAVRAQAIEKFRPKPSGDGTVILQNGLEMKVSRNFKRLLMQRIKV